MILSDREAMIRQFYEKRLPGVKRTVKQPLTVREPICGMNPALLGGLMAGGLGGLFWGIVLGAWWMKG